MTAETLLTKSVIMVPYYHNANTGLVVKCVLLEGAGAFIMVGWAGTDLWSGLQTQACIGQ